MGFAVVELFIWQTGTRGLLFKKRFKLEFILKKGVGNDIPAPFFLWRTIFTYIAHVSRVYFCSIEGINRDIYVFIVVL